MRNYYIGFGLVTVLFVGAIIYGFVSTGSPWQKRAQKLDQVRMENFTSLTYSIQTYFTTYQRLPNLLSDLSNAENNIKDPETGEIYEYIIVDNNNYKLCTKFGTDSSVNKKEGGSSKVVPNVIGLDDTYDTSRGKNHKKGYDCISYSIPNYYLNNNSNYYSQGNYYSQTNYGNSSENFPSTYNPFAKSVQLVNATPTKPGAILSPKAGSVFVQGASNSIVFSQDYLASSFFLVDENDKWLGSASGSAMCPTNDNCTSTWDAKEVYVYTNKFLEKKKVPPGSYRLIMVDSSYSTLIDKSGKFTIK